MYLCWSWQLQQRRSCGGGGSSADAGGGGGGSSGGGGGSSSIIGTKSDFYERFNDAIPLLLASASTMGDTTLLSGGK